MHIGLIGGIGPAATVFYYQGLVEAFQNVDQNLELTIVQTDVHALVRNVNSGATAAQAEAYLRLTQRLPQWADMG